MVQDSHTKITTVLHNQLNISLADATSKRGVSLTLDVKQCENFTGSYAITEFNSQTKTMMWIDDKAMKLTMDNKKERHENIGESKEQCSSREVQVNTKIDQQNCTTDDKHLALTDTPAPIHMTTTVKNNIYTRHTEPFKAKHMKWIITEVKIGPDITPEQCQEVKKLIGTLSRQTETPGQQ